MRRVYNDAEDPLVTTLIDWFDANGRDLPWRNASPWGVLVSEFMLQQTPVDRVIPAWRTWLERWPTPTALADASVADAIRAWGRLGYPRRATRLHESATAIRDRFGGDVPFDEAALRSLPGVGSYTAAAVRAFAFGRRSVPLDTNVRRVLARTRDGRARQRSFTSAAESASAAALWPASDTRSAHWSLAVMQFGALVCAARAPACDRCPVTRSCAWRAAGYPDDAMPVRRAQQRYEGSDRHARGAILQVVRDDSAASRSAIAAAWPDSQQRDRALAGLIDDGLVIATANGYSLPG